MAERIRAISLRGGNHSAEGTGSVCDSEREENVTSEGKRPRQQSASWGKERRAALKRVEGGTAVKLQKKKVNNGEEKKPA